MTKVDVTRLLTAEEVGTAWQLYEQQFTALNTRAVQRHLMTQAEFHYVCQDGNVEK
ncbi:hypothetical protein GCM10009827_119560 [Dactylosporangium maewongense]|uniref:GNAT family N-acetyltransferase n=1 Tax=Dactylosporangium maewongense TaxID=634393 RepID=A0ABP4PET2_9ACTN